MDILSRKSGPTTAIPTEAVLDVVGPYLGQTAETFFAVLSPQSGTTTSANKIEALSEHWSALIKAQHQAETYAGLLGRNPAIPVLANTMPDAICSAYTRISDELTRIIAANTKNGPDQQSINMTMQAVLFADMGAVLGGRGSNGSDRARMEIQSISEIIERETDNIIGEVGFQAGRINDVSQTMESDSTELFSLVERITQTTQTATDNIATVASATEELQASSQEIADRVHKTSDIAGQAVARAEETSQTMNSLSATAEEIGNVVDIVKRISDQTKMLALNATIEAARAGEAGKGFAVVANEVKNLATQTEKAISDINAQIQAIRTATSSAVDAISGIGGAIGEVNTLSSDISTSIEQQTAAIREISTNAQEVSAHTQEISTDIGAAQERAQDALTTAENLRVLATNIRSDVTEMDARFRSVLRSTDTRDGQTHERVPIAVDIDIAFSDTDHRQGVTADMSAAGLLARIEATEKDAGKPVKIVLDGNTHLHGRLKAVSSLGAHIQFDDLTDEVREVIHALLAKTRTHDEKIAAIGRPLAEKLGKLLEDGVRRGELDQDGLFKPHYTLIEGSDPKQYTTSFLDFTDTHFAPLQEETLEKDKAIAFAAAVDLNGYLPTHNEIYSQPQRPDDPAWNMGNARNRRIFDDRAGLVAARNTKPHLLQTYFRDMGDKVVFMKECDIPIMVNGQHWGNLRIGYRG